MQESNVGDWKIILAAITLFIMVVGWGVAHYLTVMRDASNKRREIRLQYLIDAYRILTNEVSRRDLTPERGEKLENLLSDIQLFGSSNQVELARQLANEVASGASFELDPLITSLRDDLRKELNLSEVSGNVKWLRLRE